MRIRIADIPPEGRELDFVLNRVELNKRVGLVQENQEAGTMLPPPYQFRLDPTVHVRLDLEGSMVVVNGQVTAEYQTVCSRCAEETNKSLTVPLELTLKPASQRNAPEEDLHFGVYDGQEIDCSGFSEEFLVLALPFSVLCREDCKGLCSQCGKNLNNGKCDCVQEEEGDARLSVLKGLKIH